MMNKCSLFTLLIVLLTCVLVQGNGKFNTLNCKVLKPEFAVLKECHIQAFNRTRNVINLRFTLMQTLNEVHFKIVKRESGGWHPFLYAMTVDVCDFFKDPHKYKIPGLIYNYLKPYTNVRHKCPYKANTDVCITRWQLDGKSIISRFPVDFVEYGLHTTWYYKKAIAVQVNGSVLYTPYN